MKKILALMISFAMIGMMTSYADPFNKRLTSDERARLEKGEVVIRNTGDIDKICVNKNDDTRKMIDIIEELDPAYLAEIIQIRPYKGNEDLLEKINGVFLNISEYTTIPYYSEHAEEWYMLYDSAVITDMQTLRSKKDGVKTDILADMEMDPFGVIKTQINIEKKENSIFYQMLNLNLLRYHDKFNAVKPQKMKSVITVFRDGDNWILYALGTVDTYKIFFLKDRVETSFMNRIKTFCNFIFEKI